MDLMDKQIFMSNKNNKQMHDMREPNGSANIQHLDFHQRL